MSTRDQDMRLRLQVLNKKDVLEALRGMGREGKAAASKIERAGKKAGRGLKFVDAAAKETSRELQSMGGRAGIAGRALQSLGPAGIAAAAGVAAIAAALAAGMRIAREATRVFDEMAKAARDLGLSTDAFQALRTLAIEETVPLEKLNTAMVAFARNSSRAATGRGEMAEILRQSHPDLLREIATIETMEGKLDRYIRALQEAQTQQERNILATAAFGESGLQVARMLAEQESGLQGIIDTAREMGAVVDEHILARAEEMETELSVASHIIDVNLKQAFIGLAPVIVGVTNSLRDFSLGLSEVLDRTRELEDRATRSLGVQLRRTEQEIFDEVERRNRRLEQVRGDWETFYGEFSVDREAGHFLREGADRFDSRLQLIDNRINHLVARSERLRTELSGRNDDTPAGDDGDTGNLRETLELQAYVAEARARSRTRAEELADALDRLRRAREAGVIASDEELARLEASERARLADNESVRRRAQLERQAAETRAQLGDFTALLTLKEHQLNQLVQAGVLTDQQRTQSLENYRASLEASTEAARRAAAVTEQSLTPLERYERQLEQLNDLLEQNAISERVHARAVAAAREVYEANDPVLQTAARVREELATVAERFAEEQERVNAAVAAGEISFEQADEYLRRYREMLERSAEGVEGLRFENELLEQVLRKQVSTWDDLGEVALAVLREIIIEQIRAADASQGWGSYLAQIAQGIAGSFGFGSSSSTTTTSSSGVSIPTFHRAGPVNNATVAANAVVKRRLASDEHLAVMRTNERVWTAQDNSTVMRMLDSALNRPVEIVPVGGAAGDEMTIRLVDERGRQVRSSERRSSDGKREISAFLRQETKQSVADGSLDHVLNQRFGLSPSANGR
ncbi:hypothetical protein [Maricaulis maris]|uniref:hypothetical protein n=1 Tax=Maricaulis maris TaxID=74318 RepID=UPI003B8C0211